VSAFARALERFGRGRWWFIVEGDGVRVVPRWLFLAALAVLLSTTAIADKALPPIRVTAGICERLGKNLCGKRQALVTFAPARVSVSVYLAPHPGNQAIIYGLVCDGLPVQETRAEPIPPMLLNEYRNVDAGECVAVATLLRRVKDGDEVRIERLSARSEPLIIRPQLGDDRRAYSCHDTRLC
jgi:hypothetical protein